MKVATPPAAKAFGLSDPPPSSAGGAQAPHAMRVQTAGGTTDDQITVPKANNNALIGVAVGCVVVLGVILALVMR